MNLFVASLLFTKTTLWACIVVQSQQSLAFKWLRPICKVKTHVWKPKEQNFGSMRSSVLSNDHSLLVCLVFPACSWRLWLEFVIELLIAWEIVANSHLEIQKNWFQLCHNRFPITIWVLTLMIPAYLWTWDTKCVCVFLHMSSSIEVRREYQIPESWSYRCLWSVWCGYKILSSGQASSALSHWAIFPCSAPRFLVRVSGDLDW